MTERMYTNRFNKLDAINAQIDELQKQADAIRDEIKKDMDARGVDQIEAGGRVARWKEIISNRFDSKAFKAAAPDTYKAYCKESRSKRFTITAA